MRFSPVIAESLARFPIIRLVLVFWKPVRHYFLKPNVWMGGLMPVTLAGYVRVSMHDQQAGQDAKSET